MDTSTPLPRLLRLIAITDSLNGGYDALADRLARAVRGGATSVQIRLKHESAAVILAVTRALVAALPVPVLVNDRFDIALAAGAHGVHVGTDDLPAAIIRELAPTGFIIGASAGNAAEMAGAIGADYVGIGPVYATPSKADAGDALGIQRLSDLIALAHASGVTHTVAIGGIDARGAGAPVRAGADGVAAIGAVCGAADPERAARDIAAAVDRALSDRQSRAESPISSRSSS